MFWLKDGANAKLFCNYYEGRQVKSVSLVTLMWPKGKQLLETHSDAVYCDSLWSVGGDGNFGLTIVVMDNQGCPRLAAVAIATHERTETWSTFFNWVKECVPNFKPRCIHTDGASYIKTAFTEGTQLTSTQHINCWWHEKKTVRRKWGPFGINAQALTTVYPDSMEELEAKRNELVEKIQRLRKGP